MRESEATNEKVAWDSIGQLNNCAHLLIIFQITLIILFATVGGDAERSIIPDDTPGTGTQAYNMFIGVEIMM